RRDHVEECGGIRRERRARFAIIRLPALRTQRQPNIEILSRKQADRRRADRRIPAGPDAPPCELPGQRDLVEPFLAVIANARGKDARLPPGGGDLESGELPQDFRDPMRSVELGALVDVLPAREEAPVFGRGDGRDLTAEALERLSVNAGKETAVAPCLRPAKPA